MKVEVRLNVHAGGTAGADDLVVTESRAAKTSGVSNHDSSNITSMFMDTP